MPHSISAPSIVSTSTTTKSGSRDQRSRRDGGRALIATDLTPTDARPTHKCRSVMAVLYVDYSSVKPCWLPEKVRKALRTVPFDERFLPSQRRGTVNSPASAPRTNSITRQVSRARHDYRRSTLQERADTSGPTGTRSRAAVSAAIAARPQRPAD